MKIGVADYGMNVWDGCAGGYDSEERWRKLKQLGFEGVERLTAFGADEALNRASRLRALGMDFATVRGPTQELGILWTSALGKGYVWAASTANDLETFCRQTNLQADACKRWRIRVALHNHMGTPVETQEQLESFLANCPQVSLILDTAHLAAMGGDPAAIIRNYPQRLEVLHLKDWLSLDKKAPSWQERGRFCALGKGNIGLDNGEVLRAASDAGFDGWVFVEQDSHLRDPFEDLAESMAFLKKCLSSIVRTQQPAG